MKNTIDKLPAGGASSTRRALQFTAIFCTLASTVSLAEELTVDAATGDLAVASNDTVWFDSANTDAPIPLATLNGAPVTSGFLPGWAHTANSFLKYDGSDVVEIPGGEKIVGAANLATATSASCFYDSLATTTLAADQSIGLVETTRDFLISNGATLDVALGGLMFHNNSHWVKVGTGSGNLTSSSGFLNLTVHGGSTDHRVEGVVVKDADGSTPLRLIKSGPASVAVSAPSTYTGGTLVNNGRLRGRNNASFGAAGSDISVVGTNSQLSFQGGSYSYNLAIEGLGWAEGALQRGALRFEGTSSLDGNIVLTGESRIAVNGGATATLSGTLSGSDPLSVGLSSDSFANSGGTLVLDGSAAGLTGPISVLSGRLEMNSASGSDVWVYDSASLGGEGTVAGNLEIGGSPSSRLFVNGASSSALAVAGNVDVSFGVTDIVPTAFPVPPATSFTAFTYGTLDGDVANLTADTLRGGTVSDDPANQRVVVSYAPADLVWTGAANGNWTTNEDLNFDSGSPDRFYTGDRVSFTEAASVKTLTLVGTVAPASVTFDHSSAYTVNGTGAGIIGSTGITKRGTGELLLAGQTSTFTGPVVIEQGRIKLNMFEALGRSSGVSVASGAQLDFNAKTPGTTGRRYDFMIAGSGPDGNGAITNSSATFIYEGAGIRALTLSGDAAVGGNGGRFDLGASPYTGTLTGNGHTLTKVGSGTVGFRLNGAGSPVNVVVAGGRAFAENSDNAFGGSTGNLRVKNGARVGSYGVRSIATPVVLEAGGILYNEGGGKGTWTGAITLEGNATIEANTAIDITGAVTGAFSLTKTGGQQALVSLPQHTGDTTVSNGVLSLGAATLADGSTVTIGTGSGTRLDLAHGAEDTVAALMIGTTAQAPGRYGSTASTADFKDDTRFSGTGVLNVVPAADPYVAWEIANGIAGAGADTDSDADGIINGIEFVIGGDPSGPDSASGALLPTVEKQGSQVTFRFHLTDAAASISPAVWTVEFDDDLTGSWTTATDPGNATITLTADGVSPETGAAWQRVEVTLPADVAKRFTRLRVDLP